MFYLSQTISIFIDILIQNDQLYLIDMKDFILKIPLVILGLQLTLN